jgi:hypothetical protein
MAFLATNTAGGIEITGRQRVWMDLSFEGGVPRLHLEGAEDLAVSLKLVKRFGWDAWERWHNEIEAEINETLAWAIGYVDLSVPKSAMKVLDESGIESLLPDDLEEWVVDELTKRAQRDRQSE